MAVAPSFGLRSSSWRTCPPVAGKPSQYGDARARWKPPALLRAVTVATAAVAASPSRGSRPARISLRGGPGPGSPPDLATASASSSAALATRQEVEERLVTMREKMEAIRRNEPSSIQRSNGKSDLQGVVLWCDSDPEILRSCEVLRGSGLEVQSFQEPEALLQQYLRAPQQVLCAMSSMMEGNGRKARRAMNGYDLLMALQRAAEARRRTTPLLVIISCSADEAKAKAAGADIVVLGNRIKAQNLVVTKLRKSLGLQAGYVGDKS